MTCNGCKEEAAHDAGKVSAVQEMLTYSEQIGEALARPLNTTQRELAEILGKSMNVVVEPSESVLMGTIPVPVGRAVQILGTSIDRLRFTLFPYCADAVATVHGAIAVGSHPQTAAGVDEATPPPDALVLPAPNIAAGLASGVDFNTRAGLWVSAFTPLTFVSWVAESR